jgi:2-hydroxychromene-2-carboxylate isomerase
MPQPPSIDFYFDLSSPYGYIASTRIEALAARHGRSVHWRAVLLGAVFKATGGAPLVELPLKGSYARRDFERSARFHGVPYRHPDRFPVSTSAAARLFYWLQGQEPALAIAFARQVFSDYFVDGHDISAPQHAIGVCAGLGVPAEAAQQALASATVKEALQREVQAAIDRGVFGSPFIIVEGEPFWGVDRFDQLERWLATGGF